MGVISDVLTKVDTILVSYPEQVYNSVGPELELLIQTAGVLSLIFFVLNQLYQIKNISYSEYMVWFTRYICILSFSIVWANFSIFYNIITKLPQEYALHLIKQPDDRVESTYSCDQHDELEYRPSEAGNIDGWVCVFYEPDPFYEGMRMMETISPPTRNQTTITSPPVNTSTIYVTIDSFIDRIYEIADEILRGFQIFKPSSYKYLITFLITVIVGMFVGIASLMVLLIAQVGVAVCMGLAPLAIGMLTFNVTRGYFESWLRLTVGFALVPLMVGSIMSVIVTVAGQMEQRDDVFGGYLPFILICVAAVVLLFQVPALSSSLAQTSLPAIGAGAAANAFRRMAQTVTTPVGLANAMESRIRGGVTAAQATMARGGSPVAAGFQALRGMSQSAAYRNNRFNELTRNKLIVDQAKGGRAASLHGLAGALVGSGAASSSSGGAAPLAGAAAITATLASKAAQTAGSVASRAASAQGNASAGASGSNSKPMPKLADLGASANRRASAAKKGGSTAKPAKSGRGNA